eukprot:1029859-Pyramimonas_sp.AAC.1
MGRALQHLSATPPRWATHVLTGRAMGRASQPLSMPPAATPSARASATPPQWASLGLTGRA